MLMIILYMIMIYIMMILMVVGSHGVPLGPLESKDQVDPIIQEMFDGETFSRGLELQDRTSMCFVVGLDVNVYP